MLNEAYCYSQVCGADGYPGILERQLGGVNGSVRHHNGDQNFKAAPQTVPVTTTSNYCSELHDREGEELGEGWFIG